MADLTAVGLSYILSGFTVAASMDTGPCRLGHVLIMNLTSSCSSLLGKWSSGFCLNQGNVAGISLIIIIYYH